MLMNIWQFHLLNWQGVGTMQASHGSKPSLFPFLTRDYLSVNSYIHTSLILLLEIFPVTYILHSIGRLSIERG